MMGSKTSWSPISVHRFPPMTASAACSGSRGDPTVPFETRTIASRLGRVCDVHAADFDGDGDLDLVVAVFGWHVAGEILLLEQRKAADGSVAFVRKQLDNRHGTIHVPVVDLNKDGRPDFVALISQEFETVVAFLNEAQASLRKRHSFPRLDLPSAAVESR